MKRLFALIIAMLFALGLCACGQGTEEPVEAEASGEVSATEEAAEVSVNPARGPEGEDAVVDFALSDLYSEAEGQYVVPGYSWESEDYPDPATALTEEYGVSLPLYADRNPEIWFSIEYGAEKSYGRPVFSQYAEEGISLNISFRECGLTEQWESLVSEAQELFGPAEHISQGYYDIKSESEAQRDLATGYTQQDIDDYVLNTYTWESGDGQTMLSIGVECYSEPYKIEIIVTKK